MFNRKKRRNLRHLMPGVSKMPRDAVKQPAKQSRRDNSKIKPEVVAATLIARLYRIKDERVVDLLDRTAPDPLNILGFLIKYGAQPPTQLLLRCASQEAEMPKSSPKGPEHE